MKYTTPSIEVVTFNPSDAPRIGMQWWVLSDPNNGGAWSPVPGWTLPSNASAWNTPVDCGQVGCTAVTQYEIPGEIVPGGFDINGSLHYLVTDDGQSC